MLSRVGDKWTVLVVEALDKDPKRFNELRRALGSISQRMLTLTLRALERDGLVTRTIFSTIPPRVDYELTRLGRSLLEPVHGLSAWARANRAAMEAARRNSTRRTQEGHVTSAPPRFRHGTRGTIRVGAMKDGRGKRAPVIRRGYVHVPSYCTVRHCRTDRLRLAWAQWPRTRPSRPPSKSACGRRDGGDGITLSTQTVKAGAVEFEIENTLKQNVHEFLITPWTGSSGLPYNDTKARYARASSPELAGVEDMKPGAEATLRLPMKPGHYAVFCNQAGHYKMGMVAISRSFVDRRHNLTIGTGRDNAARFASCDIAHLCNCRYSAASVTRRGNIMMPLSVIARGR